MIRRRARRRLGARGRRCSSRTATRAPRRCGATSPTRSSVPTHVVLTDVYPAGEQPQPGVSGRLVLRAVLDAHPEQAVAYLPRRADLVAHVPAPRPARRRRAHARRRRPHHRARRVAGARGVNAVDTGAALAGRAGARARRARSSATSPSPTLTTYHLGGPVAVLVRGRVARRARRASPRVVARARAAAAPRRPRLEPARRRRAGSPGSAVVLDGDFETRRPRRRPGHRCGPAARSRSRCSPRRTAAAGRTGLEFFVGIPGSVGGAVRMNAGGHGRETADVLVERRGRRPRRPAATPRRRAPPTLGFGYRRSALGADRDRDRRRPSGSAAATAAAARPTIAEIVRWRREHQPGGANAGSVFAQPAGRLRRAAHRRRSASRACGSAGRSSRRSTPTSSRPSRAPPPTTCAALVRRGAAPGARRDRDRRSTPELRMVGFDDADREHADRASRAASTPAARRARRRRPARVRQRRIAAAPRAEGRRRLRILVRRRRRVVVVLVVRRGPRSPRRSSTSTTSQVRGPRRLTAARGRGRVGGSTRGDAMVWLDAERPPSRHRGAARTSAPRDVDARVARHRAHHRARAHARSAWVDGPARQGAWSTAPAACSRSSTPPPPALPQLLGAEARAAGRAARSTPVDGARVAGGLTGLARRRARRRSTVTDHGVVLAPRERARDPAWGSRPRSTVKVRAALAVLAALDGVPVALRRRERADQPGAPGRVADVWSGEVVDHSNVARVKSGPKVQLDITLNLDWRFRVVSGASGHRNPRGREGRPAQWTRSDPRERAKDSTDAGRAAELPRGDQGHRRRRRRLQRRQPDDRRRPEGRRVHRGEHRRAVAAR